MFTLIRESLADSKSSFLKFFAVAIMALLFLLIPKVGEAAPRCYMGLGEGLFQLKKAKTNYEDRLLERRYVDGEVTKDLKDTATQLIGGCFFFENVAAEVGYIPSLKVSTDTTFNLNPSYTLPNGNVVSYTSPTLHIKREAEASVGMYSLLFYTGNRSSNVRFYAGPAYLKLYARGDVTLQYNSDFLGRELEKRAEGFTLKGGITARATDNSDVFAEYWYLGKSAKMIVFGLKAKL